MKSTVPHANIGAVDVAIGNRRLANAALEAVDVIEETEILDDHGGSRAQLSIAVRAKLLARHTQHVHRGQHGNRRR